MGLQGKLIEIATHVEYETQLAYIKEKENMHYPFFFYEKCALSFFFFFDKYVHYLIGIQSKHNESF